MPKSIAVTDGLARPAHIIVLADGEHRLAWNMNAKIALREKCGVNLFSRKEYALFVRDLVSIDLSPAAGGEGHEKKVSDVVVDGEKVRLVVWAMLLDENTSGWEKEPTITVQKVGTLLPAELDDDVMEPIIACLNDSQPKPEARKDRPFVAGEGDK